MSKMIMFLYKFPVNLLMHFFVKFINKVTKKCHWIIKDNWIHSLRKVKLNCKTKFNFTKSQTQISKKLRYVTLKVCIIGIIMKGKLMSFSVNFS